MDALKVKTDRNVRYDLSPSSRKCYFNDEYQLKIFKLYSYENCILECKILKTYEEIGCLPWNLPSIFSSICSPIDMEIVIQYMKTLDTKTLCKYCLDDCESTIITSKISTAPIRGYI